MGLITLIKQELNIEKCVAVKLGFAQRKQIPFLSNRKLVPAKAGIGLRQSSIEIGRWSLRIILPGRPDENIADMDMRRLIDDKINRPCDIFAED
jgi:hypothetical protein